MVAVRQTARRSPDDFDLNLEALGVAAKTRMMSRRRRNAVLPPAVAGVMPVRRF